MSDCLSVPLPTWRAAEVNHYGHPLERVGGGELAGNEDPLPLFWPPALATRPDFALPFHEVLARLHQRVSARIPGLVPFSAGQAALTFEGLHTSAGLDPVLRYSINHRKYRYLLLPLWYACVSADDLADQYEHASQAIWSEIQDEWRHLRGSAAIPMPREHGPALAWLTQGVYDDTLPIRAKLAGKSLSVAPALNTADRVNLFGKARPLSPSRTLRAADS